MNNTTKTGREWLELMPEPYQTQARENIDTETNKYVFEFNYISFDEFLESAFFWRRSPQGYDYWKNFFMNSSEHLRD